MNMDKKWKEEKKEGRARGDSEWRERVGRRWIYFSRNRLKKYLCCIPYKTTQAHNRSKGISRR
jgi:hypothetical protein